MAEELFIPKLGQTVEEVTLVSWLIKDGDVVSPGQAVLEVETDKAVFPVESNSKGTIHIGPFKDGDVIPVLTVVAVIGKPEDRFEFQKTTSGVTTNGISAEESLAPIEKSNLVETGSDLEGAARVFISPRAKKLAAAKSVDPAWVTPTGGDGARVVERDIIAFLSQTSKATPVAQKMAAATGVDLTTVTGTGTRGKIVKEDVTRALTPSTPLLDPEILQRIPLSGVRGIIAERMSISVHTTARVTLISEVDATEFVAMRERLKEQVTAEWGYTPGYNDVLAKIVAAALRKYPYMNARLTPEAIEYIKPINIGMAVDTERGLLVPVIRDVDQKSLRQFGQEFRTLVDRARNRKSLPDDLTGGTFTITNLGVYGVDAFTPVINLPEAAILGVGRIAPKAIPRGEQILIRQMFTLSLVFDHRLVDGAPAARFLQYIRELIEEPYLLVSAIQE